MVESWVRSNSDTTVDCKYFVLKIFYFMADDPCHNYNIIHIILFICIKNFVVLFFVARANSENYMYFTTNIFQSMVPCLIEPLYCKHPWTSKEIVPRGQTLLSRRERVCWTAIEQFVFNAQRTPVGDKWVRIYFWIEIVMCYNTVVSLLQTRLPASCSPCVTSVYITPQCWHPPFTLLRTKCSMAVHQTLSLRESRVWPCETTKRKGSWFNIEVSWQCPDFKGVSFSSGCPFRHWDKEHLNRMLTTHGVPQKGVTEILGYVENSHYQLACQKHFEITHAVSF